MAVGRCLTGVAIGLLALAAHGAVPEPALAQVSGESRPAMRVAPVILAEPETETPLAIQIGNDGQLPKQSFVRIRGLPAAAKLSEGHQISPGIWAVPLAALGTLKLTSPLASSGRSEIVITLVDVDGAVLAEVKSALVVAPAWLLANPGANKSADASRAATAAATTTGSEGACRSASGCCRGGRLHPYRLRRDWCKRRRSRARRRRRQRSLPLPRQP